MGIITPSQKDVKPMPNKVFIEALMLEKTKSNIYLPDNSDKKNYTQKGKITVLGRNVLLENCNVDDVVFFMKGIGEYTHDSFKVDETVYYNVPYDKIFAKLSKKGDSLIACNHYIICQFPKIEERTTKTGIILPETSKDNRYVFPCVVIDAPENDDGIFEGLVIYTDYFHVFVDEFKEYIAVPMESVLATECGAKITPVEEGIEPYMKKFYGIEGNIPSDN